MSGTLVYDNAFSLSLSLIDGLPEEKFTTDMNRQGKKTGYMKFTPVNVTYSA